MRTHAWLNYSLIGSCFAAAVFASCGGGADGTASGGGGTFETDGGATDSGTKLDSSVDTGSQLETGPEAKLTALTIDPPTAAISVADGKSIPVTFKAIATYDNGQKSPVTNAAWTVDFPNIATIDNAGKLSASGQLGGVAKITATLEGKSGSAQATVKINNTVVDSSVSAADRAKLEAGGPADGSVLWQYPYDGVVIPRGLQAPSLMWKGSQSGDLFEIVAENDYVSHRVFTSVQAPAKYDWPKATWTAISESGPGGPLKIQVRRLAAGKVTTLVDHFWRLTSGSMRGTVYYWSVTNGAVVRIKPGASAPEDFLKTAGVTDGCTTCHTVSADGSTLVMGNGEETGDSKATTFDLTSNKLVLSGKGRGWANSALSPDGTYMVRNHSALPGYINNNVDGTPGDGIYVAKTGVKVATTTGLEGAFLGMPSFSPDGALLAYTTIPSPGSLSVMDYDQSGPKVSNNRVLITPGADPALQHITWPTLTPDHKWVVYVRTDRLQDYGKRYPAALYIASTTNPGVEMRLANLNGDSYPFAEGDVDRLCSYEPTFAPIAAGGYYWLVFTSRRTYGSVIQYGADPHAVQQLWVAAIDQNPTPGKDPSHPAFWLSGQEPKTKNMRGFWSLDPCKKMGAGCGAASECCSQICDSKGVCGEPSTSQCSPTGGECKVALDCCGTDYQCINKHCTEPVPH